MYKDQGISLDIKIIGISGFKGSGKDTVAQFLYSNYVNSDLPHFRTDVLETAPDEPSCYFLCRSMASGIRDVVLDAFGIHYIDYGSKEVPNKLWSKRLKSKHGFSYRNMLNDVGQMFKKKYGPNFWVWQMNDRIREFINNQVLGTIINNRFPKNVYRPVVIVIPDIRFRQEIKMLENLKKFYNADVQHWLVLRDSALPAWASYGLRLSDPLERDIILNDFKPPIQELEWCRMNPKFRQVIKNDGTYQDIEKQIADIAKTLYKIE